MPDCGNSEFFINLGTNAHLDEAYGGYCVFAQVEDDASFAIVDAIAAASKEAAVTTSVATIPIMWTTPAAAEVLMAPQAGLGGLPGSAHLIRFLLFPNVFCLHI